MAGLLGAVVAGAAGGYAKSRIDGINQQQEFDLKMALADAELEKQMQLKKQGYEMDDQREQAKKDKVASIANSVTDPLEGKGGYESDEDKSKRDRGLLQQKADKLADAGEYDAAKVYYARGDAQDKSEMTKAQLELKEQQILATIENQKERNRIQEELGDAKNATQLAKLEAAVAKSNQGGSNKKTDAEGEYDSYVTQMKEQRKKPMARYQFNNWMDGKKAGFKNDRGIPTVSDEPALDLAGRPMFKDGTPVTTRKVTRKEKVPEKPVPKKSGVLSKDKNGNYVYSRQFHIGIQVGQSKMLYPFFYF